MPCDTYVKPYQTPAMRAADVRRVVDRIARDLANGRIKAVVGSQGAVAFTGLSDLERDGVTDACVYRKLMTYGGAAAKQAIARAEMLAGRRIDNAAVAAGVHSHDGGKTWGKD